MSSLETTPGGLAPEGDDTPIVADTGSASQRVETPSTTGGSADRHAEGNGDLRAQVDRVMKDVRRRTQACSPDTEEVYAAVEAQLREEKIPPTLEEIRHIYCNLLKGCRNRNFGLGWR